MIAWFGHRIERWEDFKQKYWAELRDPERADMAARLVATAERGGLTLVYGARDSAHNNAVALSEYLTGRWAPAPSTPIERAPAARGVAKPGKIKVARDFELVSWFFMAFALSIPLVLLGVWAALETYGARAFEVSSSALGALIVASLIRGIVRDRQYMRGLAIEGGVVKGEAEPLYVGILYLVGQSAATILGVAIFAGIVLLLIFHAGFI